MGSARLGRVGGSRAAGKRKTPVLDERRDMTSTIRPVPHLHPSRSAGAPRTYLAIAASSQG